MPYYRRPYGRRNFGAYRRPWRFARRQMDKQPAGQRGYLAAQRRRTAVAVPSPMRSVALAPKQGYPQRITVNLPYQKRYRDAPGVVTLTDNIFSLTNMNDIDTSGGGAVGQARAWDQWTTAYDYYRVNWVKVHLLIRQRASHGLAGYLVPNATTSSISDSRPYEMQMSTDLGVTASNVKPLEITRVFYPHRILGMSPTEYQASDETAGAVGAAPTQNAYLHLLMQQVDNATALDAEFDIQFLFNVTLFDRADVPVS